MARRQERLGSVVLSEVPWEAPVEALAAAAFEGLRDLGLPWTAKAARLRARIALAGGEDWPDCSDAGLLAERGWLLPWLGKARSAADLKGLDLTEALEARLGWERLTALERLVPEAFVTPLGRKIAIDYAGGVPEISIRLQEMFGVTSHPVVGVQRTPVKVTLLSPRQAPIQVTTDVPGFWKGSYAEVRKNMRAEYPRHPWPEDGAVAEPTLRAKPRRT
jgi:ATP-dependent helicase HrpB